MWTPAKHPNRAKNLPPRSAIKGWTVDAARRNRAFLMSVDPHLLACDVGYACTMTLGDTPEDAVEWQAIVDRWLTGLRRLGMVRYHWVVEWTRKGRPHLHASVYFPAGWIMGPVHDLCQLWPEHAMASSKDARAEGPWSAFPRRKYLSPKIIGPHGRRGPRVRVVADTATFTTDYLTANDVYRLWDRASQQIRTSPEAQHVERIDNALGWSAYVAKHAARGVDHYQKAGDLPEGWTKSGRLWSKGGEWPTRVDDLEVDAVTYHRMRRGVRRWMVARLKAKIARTFGKPKEQAEGELRFAKRQRAGYRQSVQGDNRPPPRTTSNVAGLVTFASRDDLDNLLVWAMDHPQAFCMAADTGELFRYPATGESMQQR